MKKIIFIFTILLYAVTMQAQVVEEDAANRAGTYIYTHSDTVTADSSQIYQFYNRIGKTAELVQGVSLTKVSGYVKANVIRAYSFDGSNFTNLDTATVASTTSAQAVFNVIDLDYPYYKVTVDGVDSTQVVYPLKFYSIVKEK